MHRSYHEMLAYNTFMDRFEYLKLSGEVAHATFGSDRWVNQKFYASDAWKRARRDAILRDGGCDLGIPDRKILGRVYVHHMNPLTVEDIVNRTSKCFDLDNLITCSYDTHQAITYGTYACLPSEYVPRTDNDTAPWLL